MVNFGVTSLITDRNFFSFFSLPLKEGDVETTFSGPDNVIITESAARKYFPGENPMGQPIVSHGHHFTVSGVMYDIPRNSHIQAEVIFPLFGEFKTSEWNSSFSYDTYFLIAKHADLNAIEGQLTLINKTGTGVLMRNEYSEVKLEPLKEIHFSKIDSEFDSAVKGDKNFLTTLIFTASIILIIGCINFTNLFISTAFIRAKSIGIKKSQGAGRKALILGFYKETAIYVLISTFGGVILAILTLPIFNTYIGSTTIIDFRNPQLYLFLIFFSHCHYFYGRFFSCVQNDTV